MKLHFKDQAFSFELLRAASYAGYQGAEIGECLATAANIKEADFNSWFEEWEKTAKRVEKIGENCLSKGHVVSGREALLRASNYYRTAEFFLKATDSRRDENYKKSVETFQKAMSEMDYYYEIVKIPYENSYMAGYFYRALDYDKNKQPCPTLIFIGGFDSTAEELYFCGAAAAIKRGYNCLVFDGPGQGETLRIQKIPTRFDYEVPVRAAIDYLESRRDVDMDKISLMGMSMGGYYAPRAAAFDKRIRACIAYDVFYDLWNSTINQNPKLKKLEGRSPMMIETMMRFAEKRSSNLRWAIQNSLWVFGIEHRNEIPETLKKYTLKGIADKIDCPLLILVGEADHFVSPEQVDEFANELKCSKTIRVFTREEGAEEHCQEGNHALFHQVMFDWLDDTLKI